MWYWSYFHVFICNPYVLFWWNVYSNLLPRLVFFCFFNYKFICFNWRIIALYTFVVFFQTSIWISHRYTYSPSLLNFPPVSLPILPFSQPHIEPLFEFPESYIKFPLAVYFTYGNVSFHVSLFIHLMLSSPLSTSISLFSMSVSPLLPCK